MLRATTVRTFSTSQVPKVVRTPSVLYILTSKCVSHHNGVHFFDIWTPQKWSEPWIFCIFWFRNVLRATTAYTFSTSQFPKVVRTLQFLTHFTSKCTSRHNGVQLFISHFLRCFRTRRFSEPTFQPSGATIPRKKQYFATFLFFRAPASFFF